MAAKNLYRYNNQDLDIHQVHTLYGKNKCGVDWLRNKLKLHSVSEVLEMKPMTHAQVIAKSKSPWRQWNPPAPKDDKAETKSPFEKMRHNQKMNYEA